MNFRWILNREDIIFFYADTNIENGMHLMYRSCLSLRFYKNEILNWSIHTEQTKLFYSL